MEHCGVLEKYVEGLRSGLIVGQYSSGSLIRSVGQHIYIYMYRRNAKLAQKHMI